MIGLSVAAKPEFGRCQTRVWPLPNPSVAAAKPKGSCQATKPGFGRCQTRVWQLPNPSLAAAKPEFGSCQTRIVYIYIYLFVSQILYLKKINIYDVLYIIPCYSILP